MRKMVGRCPRCSILTALTARWRSPSNTGQPSGSGNSTRILSRHVVEARANGGFYERLFRPEKMRYERLVHCVAKPDGPVSVISGFLDHYPFSKGIADWVTRHNRYSTLDVQQTMMDCVSGKRISAREIFSPRDASNRRKNLKELYYGVPMRPCVRFSNSSSCMCLNAGFSVSRQGGRPDLLRPHRVLRILNRAQGPGT